MKPLALLLALALPAIGVASPDDDAVAVQIAIAKALAEANSPSADRGAVTSPAAYTPPKFQGPVDAHAAQMKRQREAAERSGKRQAAVPVQPLTDRENRAAAVLFAEDLPPDAQPTPMEGVTAALNALQLKPDDVFADFGCGFDARFSINAARRGVKQCVAIEIDDEIADSAREYVKAAGYADRIEVITADATKTPVNATCGAAYLWPETLKALRPQIEKLDRFVSYAHAVPGLPMRPMRTPGGAMIWVYQKPKPKPAMQIWQETQRSFPTAVWNGRQYSRPVCNRAGCSMCNAIRAQLFGR